MVHQSRRRILSFDQEEIFKQYIDFNSAKRSVAKSDFEKDMYKLMNNALFGKTCEDVSKRIDIKFINLEDENKFVIYANKPNYKYHNQVSEDLMAVNMGLTTIKYNKPIAIGFCVLDISKTFMYDFHYNTIMKKYGDKAKLLFTDTDSLCYEIKCEDFYADMKDDLDKYDLSNYPEDHPLYLAHPDKNKNKKVPLKMKLIHILLGNSVGCVPNYTH